MLSCQNLYSLSKEAKAHASAGDLKYFEDLKQKMGEEDFRAFVKNQYYKKGDVSVPDILPNNLLLSAALGESGNNLEVAMFLVQNGAAVQTKKMFTMLHKSSYYGTCSEILDLIIAGNGDLLAPPFKRFTYTNIDLLEYDIMNTVEIALSCDNVSALHKIRTYLENYDYTKFSNQEITVGKKKESLSKLLKHYLQKPQWSLYQAIRLGAPKCTAWLLEQGVPVEAPFSFKTQTKKLVPDEYILLKTGKTLQEAMIDVNLYENGGSLLSDPKTSIKVPVNEFITKNLNVLKSSKEAGLSFKINDTPTYISYLYKNYKSCAIKKQYWDPQSYMDPLTGLCICWVAMNYFPAKDIIAAKDPKGNTLEWYIENIPAKYVLENNEDVNVDNIFDSLPAKPKPSKANSYLSPLGWGWTTDSDNDRDTMIIMKKFRDMCRLKYEMILNMNNNINISNNDAEFLYEL